MKLIFDCISLTNWKGHPTGIQRVVIEVGERLCRISPQALLGIFDHTGACFHYDLERRRRGKLIELDAGDVVITVGANWDYPDHHSLLLSFVKKGIKIVTFFHDIIPIVLPYSYGPGFSEKYEKWFKEALSSSDLAFSNSEHTRQDIITYASSKLAECPNIFPVRLGDELRLSRQSPTPRIRQHAEHPYILSVGTMEYRKNHILLLNAYRYMLTVQGYEPPKLLIVGKKGWLDHDIEYQVTNDPHLLGRVSILQDVSDGDLQHLYREALFTVYPSIYEGWGLPVAESLCFGKPCIASGTSSMQEIAPGLVKHAHPFRLDEWVDAIREFTDDPEKLKQATDSIRLGYKKTSWNVTASSIFDVLASKYPEFRKARKMKLYFDYTTMLHWQGNVTGIPRTVFSLAMSMQELHPEIQFLALDGNAGGFRLLEGDFRSFKLGEEVIFSEGDVFFSAGAGWALASYRDRIQEIKNTGVKFYQVFYDLIPAIFPYFYEQGLGFGNYFLSWSKEIFALCDGAFAISSCTKDDMVSLLALHEQRARCIKVIRLGEDFSPSSSNANEVTRFGKGGDFLLSVGTLEVRKNQACLLNAYRLLAQHHDHKLPKLILVGKQGFMDGDIAFQVDNDRSLNGLVQIATDVDDTELQWLYENCLFSLFPAMYEGWGLPVAESLKSGRPCISSGVSSMLEIAPELTIFASPHSAENWAAAISYFLANTEKLTELSNRIKSEYSPTTWASTAEDILDSIKEEASGLMRT
jgi:glycosyltransferase involved in cell wall biosynthesis